MFSLSITPGMPSCLLRAPVPLLRGTMATLRALQLPGVLLRWLLPPSPGSQTAAVPLIGQPCLSPILAP